MKKIFYVGYYDCEKNKVENRYHILAATNKMTYICSAINRAGFEVEIVSASGTESNLKFPGKRIELMPNTRLTLFPTRGYSLNKIIRVFHRWLLNGHFFLYLFTNIKKEDTVIVYHSLRYATMLRILKNIKKFRLVLEVEEFYSDVTGKKSDLKKEMKIFRLGDAYIFPTELLDEKINQKKLKPSVVIYGTYQIEKKEYSKFTDKKIHCVYAGTLDPRKGGAMAAAAAKYLSNKYHIHILGFGSNEEIRSMKKLVNEINEKSDCTLTYDGIKDGNDYTDFIGSCDIGLSTQRPDAAFNNTSFPSKVLSYLSNGLRVVSIKIEALEKSSISNLLVYYKKNKPQAIAEAIKSIDFENKYNSITLIKELDKNFVKEIGDLLK